MANPNEKARAGVMENAHGTIANLIYTSCLLLDEERYDDWLDRFCQTDFVYRITTYSTEIRKRMTWFEQSREDLRQICFNLPEHVIYQGKFHRHATLYTVEVDAETRRAEAITSLIVVHTDLEGKSELYAAGRYKDMILLDQPQPLLVARDVELDTRVLPFGSHRPL